MARLPLRRRWDLFLQSLNFDAEGVDQPYLAPEIVPTMLHSNASEMVQAPMGIEFAGMLTPATNAARFSVVEIQALRGEIILWSVFSSVAVNWQRKHSDDGTPITNDLATPSLQIWRPRGTRVEAAILNLSPNEVANTGTNVAVVNYSASTAAVYSNTIPISSGFSMARDVRVPLGSSLVAQHATVNTAFTVTVWGVWIPRDEFSVGGPPLG